MASEPFRISKANLVTLLNAIVGKAFGEFDSANALASSAKNKGRLGNVLEQSVIGYPANPDQRPDLLVDGVPTELKVTGLIASPRSKRGWRAKEPMSITAVSPNEIIGEEFYTSAFWEKAEHLLIIYYLYVRPGKGVKFAQYATFEVKGYDFHVWTELDIERLKNDWTQIRDFVRHALQGDREELLPQLSTLINPELLYLDTAPKYPHSPRFRFKNSFVTAIAASHFGSQGIDSPRITSMGDLDRSLNFMRLRYGGRTIRDIAADMHIPLAGNGREAKSLTEMILVRLFSKKAGKVSSIELFSKSSITCCNVTLTTKGKRTEDLKLEPTLDFDDLLDREATFEDSSLGSLFIDTTIICAVYEEAPGETDRTNNRFLGFKRLWLGELEEDARKLWQDIRNIVFSDKLIDMPVLDSRGNQRIAPKTQMPMSAPNWPKSKDGTLFLRGSGRDASDKTLVINGVRMYRQNIWVKGTWVARQLGSYEYI